MRKLTEAELKNLPDGWAQNGHAIVKTYALGSYADHLAFTNLLGRMADRHDHHPDITLTYPSVHVLLSTHSEGGVTDKDLEMAKVADGIATMFA